MPFKPVKSNIYLKPRKKITNQQVFATVAGKQGTGTVDILRQTKTEIDAENKFNFDYVCSEDDLMVNKEIFGYENSKSSNISLKGNLKRNIAYWQNTLMANEL